MACGGCRAKEIKNQIEAVRNTMPPKRPCTCDDTTRCRLCLLFHTNQDYRTLWGGGPLPLPAQSDKKIILVKMTSPGMGDALMGLLAVGGLKKDRPGQTIVYAVPHGNIPWAQLFDGYDHLTDVNANLPAAWQTFDPWASWGVEYQERSKLRRCDYYCGACQTRPVLPTARIPEAAMTWAGCYKDAVVLAPFSHWGNRNWSVPHWRALIDLLQKEDMRPIVIDHDPGRCGVFDCEKVMGETAARVAAVVKLARVTVGLDSGIAHLAGCLQAPMLALCSPTDGEKIFGVYGSVRWLSGRLPCGGCYWQGPLVVDACGSLCANMLTITPDDVMRGIHEDF